MLLTDCHRTRCNKSYQKICNVKAHHLLVMKQNVIKLAFRKTSMDVTHPLFNGDDKKMRLPVGNRYNVTHFLLTIRCDETVFQKNVQLDTHLLLVIGLDIMSLLSERFTVESLTTCWSCKR